MNLVLKVLNQIHAILNDPTKKGIVPVWCEIKMNEIQGDLTLESQSKKSTSDVPKATNAVKKDTAAGLFDDLFSFNNDD